MEEDIYLDKLDRRGILLLSLPHLDLRSDY